ncbi:P-loop NTPase family protein, partial [Staphylococcus epidermidis]
HLPPVLARFFFVQQHLKKIINHLSPPQKPPLQLPLLIFQPHNLLILHQPTNHLHIHSKQILQQPFKHFERTIIFLSHHPYFINQLPNKLFHLNINRAQIFFRHYHYYIHKTQQAAPIKAHETLTQNNFE